MKNSVPICMALGTVWRWEPPGNRDILLPYLSDLDIDGVEITLATENNLRDFKPSPEHVDWLRSLPWISIHAPFHLDAVRPRERLREIFERLTHLVNLLNAQNVVVHPTGRSVFDFALDYDLPLCTENLSPNSGIGGRELERILERYPDLGLCIDVAHAFFWSSLETARLVGKFGDRVRQVHLSGVRRKTDHNSLQGMPDEYMQSIAPIADLTVPIIIEEELMPGAVNLLHEEVAFVRRWWEIVNADRAEIQTSAHEY